MAKFVGHVRFDVSFINRVNYREKVHASLSAASIARAITDWIRDR